MNFIDRMKIKRNPNTIDYWSDGKISEEVIKYAIDNGYKFKLSYKYKFMDYSIYIETFKNEPEFLADEIKLLKRSGEVSKFFSLHAKEKLFEYIKQNDNIAKEILVTNYDENQSFIKENLGEFIPYLTQFEKLNIPLNTDLILSAKQYLKDNEIVYNENIPKFALKDEEYVIKCLQLDPTSMVTINEINKEYCILLDKYPDAVKKIAEKINKEQIKFEKIPYVYQKNKEIYESIVKCNLELLEKSKNCDGIGYITGKMPEEEIFDYYKSMGYPFNANTVSQKSFPVILECLKNDHKALANNDKKFIKLEEDEQIYEELKDNIIPEEVLNNKFLMRNPYFIIDLLNKKVDLEGVDLSETRSYKEMFLKIKASAIKSEANINIPTPAGLAYEFNDKGLCVKIENLESIKKGLEYLNEIQSEQELIVIIDNLGKNKKNEFIIGDNIEFFEELDKKGININIRYDFSSAKIFSLKEILRMEHFIKDVVEDIKSKNFSPLEQLIAIYDISKSFKPYKDIDKETASRALYEYLDNEYMVCAGYTNLIVNLAHRLNLQCDQIGLGTEEFGKIVLHSRNYVNIVDGKYGIDGFYVLEPTWEHNGKLGDGNKEENKSKYKFFLLTTDEGRKDVGSIKILWDKNDQYDSLFTMQNPEEIRKCLQNGAYKEDWYTRMSILDPEFYKKMISLDLNKDEDINVLKDYFKTKVNNPVPKDKLLDAIIEVKKSIYVNLTEQDFEDMKMAYSIAPPFGINETWKSPKSIYGEKYNEYINRRYETIKSKTIQETQKENTCLDVETIFKSKVLDVLSNYAELGEASYYTQIKLTDEKMVLLLKKHQNEIEKIGFDLFFNNENYCLDLYHYVCYENLSPETKLEDIIEGLNRKIEKLLYQIEAKEQEDVEFEQECEITIEELKKIGFREEEIKIMKIKYNSETGERFDRKQIVRNEINKKEQANVEFEQECEITIEELRKLGFTEEEIITMKYKYNPETTERLDRKQIVRNRINKKEQANVEFEQECEITIEELRKLGFTEEDIIIMKYKYNPDTTERLDRKQIVRNRINQLGNNKEPIIVDSKQIAICSKSESITMGEIKDVDNLVVGMLSQNQVKENDELDD